MEMVNRPAAMTEILARSDSDFNILDCSRDGFWNVFAEGEVRGDGRWK